MKLRTSTCWTYPSRTPFRLAFRLAVAALLCTGATGCSWNSAIGASFGGTAGSGAAVGAGTGSAAASTTTVVAGGTGLYASISLGTAAANILAAATGLAIYAAMLQESGEFHLGQFPPMREDRAINEQDCTKPITDTQANLKCK
jgi:hypothetical protein